MNGLIQHFLQPQYATIANAILIPAKVQSHKLEHKEKQEVGDQPVGKWFHTKKKLLHSLYLRGSI